MVFLRSIYLFKMRRKNIGKEENARVADDMPSLSVLSHEGAFKDEIALK